MTVIVRVVGSNDFELFATASHIIITVESPTTERPVRQQVEHVAGDRCFPLTHSDQWSPVSVSQKAGTLSAREGRRKRE